MKNYMHIKVISLRNMMINFSSKRMKPFIIIIIVYLTSFSTVFSQSKDSDMAFEDIYIHTDKTIYTPGEDVWFKAYILDKVEHIPLVKSKILYLSALNNKGEILFSDKFPINNGFAWGEFHIPDSITKQQEIQIIAYTENLRDLAPSTWFHSKLVIDPSPVDLWNIIYKPDLSTLSKSILSGNVYCLYHNNFPIRDLKVKWKIVSNGKEILSKTGKTDSLGRFNLNVDISEIESPGKNIVLCLEADYLNDTKELKINIPIGKESVHLSFYPEGGSLVQGLKNKVAFEATDNFGAPLNIQGVLINQNGDILKEIETYHEGMGIITLTPTTEEKYFVRIDKPIQSDTIYQLPEPIKSGYVLSLEMTDKSVLSLKINMTPDLKGEKVRLSLSNGITSKNIFESVLEDEKYFSFLSSAYPVGINTLTLLSEKGEPLAERLVFLNKYKKMHFSVKTDKKIYNPRDEVELTVKATDFKGNPTSANLSVSVAESGRISNQIHDISSYLLLGSELKGTINNPSWYLEDSAKADSALNMLLMVHGWRKVKIVEEYSKLVLSPDNIPVIRGHVYKRRKKPAIKATVQIINTRTWQVISTVTNNDGAFIIPVKDYLQIANSPDLSISATIPNKKNTSLIIEIDPETDPNIFSGFQLKAENKSLYNLVKDSSDYQGNKNVKSRYTDFDNSTQYIDEVVVKGKKISPPDTQEDIRERMYKINKKESEEIKTFDLQSSNESFDGGILQLLRTIAPGFQLSPLGIIIYRGYSSLVPEFEQGVLFVVDGIPKGDKVDAVSWINISDIQEIKVITNPGAALIYSSGGSSGVVEITLKDAKNFKPGVEKEQENKSLSVIKGFKVVKEFYSPNYSNNAGHTSNIDFRSTLYWNPNFIIDNTGQKKIKFFNGDKKTEFRCYINGVNKSGLMGASKMNYNVE